MGTFRLLKAEILHRKLNFLFSLVAVITAATLFVAGPTILRGYQRESGQRLEAMAENADQTLKQIRQEKKNQLGKIHQDKTDQWLMMNQERKKREAEILRETEKQLAEIRQETEKQLADVRNETAQTLQQRQDEAAKALVDLDKRTKRIMRDLGFNLRIVHKNTDLTQLFAKFVSFDMPESYVEKLASSPEITKIVHLVATLKQMVEVDGQSRLLVGFAPEATQSHIEQKSPMGFQIKTGTVYLGHVAAKKKTGTYKVGEKITILGKEFKVARVLPPHGTSSEDIAIAMHLKDAQQVLKKPKLISEIVALGCKCKTINRIEEITAQLEGVLPDTKVIELRVQAIAREDQRKLVTKHYAQQIENYKRMRAKILKDETADQQAVIDLEKQRQDRLIREEEQQYKQLIQQQQQQQDELIREEEQRHDKLISEEQHQQDRLIRDEAKEQKLMIGILKAVTDFVIPLIVLVCVIWIGLLAWSNVRERRTEIGLFRALGKKTTNIVMLFLGKAIIVGVLGGLMGCALGICFAAQLAQLLPLQGSLNGFRPGIDLIIATVIGAPLLTAMASYLPTLLAIRQDPAVVLMDH